MHNLPGCFDGTVFPAHSMVIDCVQPAAKPLIDITRMAEQTVSMLRPTGVIEEHGPHMKLGVDTYIPLAICRLTRQQERPSPVENGGRQSGSTLRNCS